MGYVDQAATGQSFSHQASAFREDLGLITPDALLSEHGNPWRTWGLTGV